MRRPTRRRLAAAGVVVAAVAATLLARSRSEPAGIDRRTGYVARVVDGVTIEVHLDRLGPATVRLLGIDAPDVGEFAEQAKAYLEARAANQRVTLRIDELTRPGEAYVYLAENELLNEAIVRDGWAFARRDEPCDFGGLIEQQENAARAARRGMWRTMTVEQMPAWRQRWMRDRGIK